MSNHNDFNSRISFLPAQLYTGPREWFVYFSAIHPETGALKRKKIKVNRIKCEKERAKYARFLIKEINDKLYTGWNPWHEEHGGQVMTALSDVLKKFLREKEKELRPASMRSYYSYVATFENWLRITKMDQSLCIHFEQQHAIKFMEWVYDSKDVAGKTFNNYRTFFRNLFNWMIAKQYAKENYFVSITKKKEQQKERVIIEQASDRMAIKEYFKEHDFPMYIVCLLVYHTLIRPGEIVHLKRGHFNFRNQTITIPASNAKNAKLRISTIPDVLLGELIAWDFGGAQSHEYIFGKNWRPGKEAMDPKRLAKKWDRMRSALHLPKTYQLYSLRDTGIVMLLRSGVSPDEVMKQAGHHSLEVTTIYARHYNSEGSEMIKELADDF
jgi:integrase